MKEMLELHKKRLFAAAKAYALQIMHIIHIMLQ